MSLPAEVVEEALLPPGNIGHFPLRRRHFRRLRLDPAWRRSPILREHRQAPRKTQCPVMAFSTAAAPDRPQPPTDRAEPHEVIVKIGQGAATGALHLAGQLDYGRAMTIQTLLIGPTLRFHGGADAGDLTPHSEPGIGAMDKEEYCVGKG